MRKILSVAIISLALSSIVSCSNSRSMQEHDQTNRIDAKVSNKYVKYSSSSEEYINRINKRVMLVSNQPNLNYHFSITSDSEPTIEFDPENNNISISRGVLDQIRDEAELAAVLYLSTAKMSGQPGADRSSLTLLYRAGYDPQAMVDLQQQYLIAGNAYMSWLGTIYPIQISMDSMNSSQATVNTMPKGLLRGAEGYQKQISG